MVNVFGESTWRDSLSAKRPRAHVWDRSECERAHQATLDLLGSCGVEVRQAGARTTLEEAGAKVEGVRVRLPADLIEWALGLAPSRIQISARSEAPALTLGVGESYFGSGPDCLYVRDHLTAERRRALTADVAGFAALCDHLPNIDFVMSMALPDDTSAEKADLVQFAAMLAHTQKPIVTSSPYGGGLLPVMREMAALCGEQKSFACLTMTTPPLVLSAESVDKIACCAGLGIPVILAPAPAAGATAPASIAATVLVGNAEVIAGLVIHQLTKPGAPFVYGVGAGMMDMRTAVDTYCRPEHFVGNQAACDLGRYYKLPTWGYAGMSDSKLFDEQLAAEAAASTLVGALSGADLLHDVGYFESGLSSSYEALVLGDELVGYAKGLLRGISTDDESIALPEIRAAGPGGNHLGSRHTRVHRQDFWHSDLFDRSVFDRWESDGARTLGDRVRERTETLLGLPPLFELPAEARARLQVMLTGAVGS